MNIDDLTFKQIKKFKIYLTTKQKLKTHPMLGRRCLLRCYSSGVHIGTICSNKRKTSTEVYLKRFFKTVEMVRRRSVAICRGKQWDKDGRLNKTGDIYLTGVIEFYP